jgi:hypothetical protein
VDVGNKESDDQSNPTRILGFEQNISCHDGDIILFDIADGVAVNTAAAKLKYKISRLRPGIRSSTRSHDIDEGCYIGNDLYCLKPTAPARIPLHIYDGESSDQRTRRGAHTTTTRELLLGRVITLRSGEFHRRRRRRRRDRVTTRTRALGSGMSPLLLLLPLSVCCCIWRGRSTCDHVWGEDIVECYAMVV